MKHTYAPCFEQFPVDKFVSLLSEILSEKHDAKITITAKEKARAKA